MTRHGVTLDDKYDLSKDRVFLSGTQAIVRLVLMQRARDRAAGFNTAGFIFLRYYQMKGIAFCKICHFRFTHLKISRFSAGMTPKSANLMMLAPPEVNRFFNSSASFSSIVDSIIAYSGAAYS